MVRLPGEPVFGSPPTATIEIKNSEYLKLIPAGEAVVLVQVLKVDEPVNSVDNTQQLRGKRKKVPATAI